MREFVEITVEEKDVECCTGKGELQETGASKPTVNVPTAIAGNRVASATQFVRRVTDASQRAFRADRRAAIKDLMLFGFGGFALIERYWRDEPVNRVEVAAAEPFVPSFAAAKPAGVDAVVANWRLTLPLLNHPMSSLPSSRLPNASRAYRHGVHGGFDLYCPFGSPVRSVAAGIVTRADSTFNEVLPDHYQHLLATCAALGMTPPDVLRRLMGRTVEIDHGLKQGIRLRSVYAHLSAVAVSEGDSVQLGEVVGEVGNSGTSAGVRGTHEDAHLHFELRFQNMENNESYFGEGITERQLRQLFAEVFGNG